MPQKVGHQERSQSQQRRTAPKGARSLRRLNPHAAGIDIGATHHWVAIPATCDPEPVRRFGTFTADLYALADWLQHSGIETIVMESTGIYWLPVFEVLEERGFEVKLVDPHAVKQVPGHKTDVRDCQWLQELHTYGLLRGAFRPEEQVCTLRSYLRQREMLIATATRAIQHMQKALEQMNLKRTEVVSTITGKTGRQIIRAILAGERDPQRLARYRDVRCKQSTATIAQALAGHWRAEHVFALRQAVDQYDFLQQQRQDCDTHIEACLQQLASRTDADRGPLPPARKVHARPGNAPMFDVRASLYTLTGVDLTQVEGIDALTALKAVSEIGVDMTRWPTSKPFASWLGLCLGNKISGGKRYRARSQPTANRAAPALRVAAQTLTHSHSALGAYYRRMRARLGAPKALTATAHKLARLVYSMLRYGTAYVDKGQATYEQQYRERTLRALKRKAQVFGFTLVALEESSGEGTPATT